MMKIAICEDNKAQADHLESMIKAWAEAENHPVEIGKYQSGEQFLASVDDTMNYEIIFIDIQMGHLDGVELARIIRREYYEPILIFTTGLREQMSKGYEVSALRYLVKPIREKEVEEALSKSCEILASKAPEAILLTLNRETRRIFKSEIRFVETDNHYLTFHLKQEEVRVKAKLSDYEDMLEEPRFCKIHRSYIVNLHFAASVSRDGVKMESGEFLPLSRNRWEAVNHCYLRCYA